MVIWVLYDAKFTKHVFLNNFDVIFQLIIVLNPWDPPRKRYYYERKKKKDRKGLLDEEGNHAHACKKNI